MMDLQESLHTASSICDRGRRLDLSFFSLLNCLQITMGQFLFCLSSIFFFFISIFLFLRHLDRAKRGVSVGGLGILAKHRKKQHLLILLESLRTIKTLVRKKIHCTPCGYCQLTPNKILTMF